MTAEHMVIANIERRLDELENRLNHSDEVTIYIEPTSESQIPKYANPTDAGADLIADEDMLVGMFERKIMPTGIKVAIPEGYEIQLRPRSGICAKLSLMMPNSPGTIDTGYRGTIGVIVYNAVNQYTKVSTKFNNCSVCRLDGTEADYADYADLIANYPGTIVKGFIFIKKGERIAQMVVNRIAKAKFVVTNDVSKIGSDRNGGFGSSGVN